jgi:hypothetical protein
LQQKKFTAEVDELRKVDDSQSVSWVTQLTKPSPNGEFSKEINFPGGLFAMNSLPDLLWTILANFSPGKPSYLLGEYKIMCGYAGKYRNGNQSRKATCRQGLTKGAKGQEISGNLAMEIYLGHKIP